VNVLFVVVDALRADRLGCYGYWRKDISPRIDRIAAEGVRFRDFHASAVAAGPGISSLHTGLCAIHHRFYLTPAGAPNLINFDDRIATAAEFFLDHGYATAAVDDTVAWESPYKGTLRGYNAYLYPQTVESQRQGPPTADAVNAMALPWLRENAARKPFFMYLHYRDPRAPYNHPQEFRNHYRHVMGTTDDLPKAACKGGYEYVPGWGAARDIKEGPELRERTGLGELSHDLYDEAVRYMDSRVGQVVDALGTLGVLGDTCVIVTAGHGAGLGHWNCWLHEYLDQPAVAVPLIIRCPKAAAAGKVAEGIAQHADVLPTMLDLAGVTDPRAKFDGASLLPQIQGKAAGRPYAFIEGGDNWRFARALIESDWKIIKYTSTDKTQLYCLADDPAEMIDLSEKEPQRLKEMEAKLDGIVKEMLRGQDDPIPRGGTAAAQTYPLRSLAFLLNTRQIRK